MKYLMIFACLIGITGSLQAHQPDISTTMLVERGEGQWLLQINASLTAFQYEVRAYFGEDAYASPEEFQELVLLLTRERVLVQINDGSDLELRGGEVKLGHATTVVFQLEGVPERIDDLRVTNRSFANIHRNQSALVFLKQGYDNEQYILNNDNDHTVNLELSAAAYRLHPPAKASVAIKGVSMMSFLGLVAMLTFASLKYLFSKQGV